jgi:hypothetical protein
MRPRRMDTAEVLFWFALSLVPGILIMWLLSVLA